MTWSFAVGVCILTNAKCLLRRGRQAEAVCSWTDFLYMVNESILFVGTLEKPGTAVSKLMSLVRKITRRTEGVL